MLVFGWISDKLGRKFGMVRRTGSTLYSASDIRKDVRSHYCGSFLGPVRRLLWRQWQLQRHVGYALRLQVGILFLM